MANAQRRLKRSSGDQALEIERIRAVTLRRLAGVPEPDGPQSTVASVPSNDSDAASDNVHTDPSQAALAAGGPEADEAIDVTEPVEQAPAAKVRQPLVYRIAGLDEAPAPVLPDPELDATPLVMFLGAPGPTWTADPTPPSADEPSVALDGVAQDTLFAGEPPELAMPTSPEVAGSKVAVESLDAESVPEPSVAERPSAMVSGSASLDARAYCPYCATILQPPPTSDRRCTECKQQIVVRHIDDRTVWLAEAALPVFEAERLRIADQARWTAMRAHWLDLALAAGAPKSRVEKAADEAPTEARASAARTLYLASVDRSFESATKDDQWAVAARIRFDEALVLFAFAGAPIPDTRDAS